MTTTRHRRRRRGHWSRVRRYLFRYRFNAAEVTLVLVALTSVLWLLWPAPEAPLAQRQAWRDSFEEPRQVWAIGEPQGNGGPIDGAEASIAVSAKKTVVGTATTELVAFEHPRLAKVAATMPAIGVPGPGMGAGGPQLPGPVAEGAGQTMQQAVLRPPNSPPHEWGSEATPLPPATRGTTPTWLRNAVATPLADDRPAITVVIDDLGLNRRNTAALNRLPGPLTLSFLPYADALDRQTHAARAAGHELLLHLPMEPLGREWPGPNALLTSLPPDEVVSRLRRQLRSFRGFVGINNHMGSLFTADRTSMTMVMAELHQRDLLFLDSRTTANSVGVSEARRQGVPTTSRDVFIDNDTSIGAIRTQLLTVERIARRKGVAVAIGHPNDTTIEALRGWLPTLKDKGFALIPISAVVARQSCVDGTLADRNACGHYVSAQYLAP